MAARSEGLLEVTFTVLVLASLAYVLWKRKEGEASAATQQQTSQATFDAENPVGNENSPLLGQFGNAQNNAFAENFAVESELQANDPQAADAAAFSSAGAI